MKRKLIAVLLLAAMIVCMVPTEVFAADDPLTIYVKSYLWDKDKETGKRQTTTPIYDVQYIVSIYDTKQDNKVIFTKSTIEIITEPEEYITCRSDNGVLIITISRTYIAELLKNINSQIWNVRYRVTIEPVSDSIGYYYDEETNDKTFSTFAYDTSAKAESGYSTDTPTTITTKQRVLLAQNGKILTGNDATYVFSKNCDTDNNSVISLNTSGSCTEHYFYSYLVPTDQFYTVYKPDGTATVHGLAETFDATTLVSANHLYAGLTTDAKRTTRATGVNGKALTGAAGDTFYVREIPDTYLQPASMAVKTRGSDSADQYMLTALDQAGVDNGFYTRYGFLDANGQQIGLNEAAPGDHDVINEAGQLYNKLQIVENGHTKACFTAKEQFSVGSDDYIGCVKMGSSSEATLDVGGGTTFVFDTSFTPYYVTHDGVLVTGSYTRYMNDVGALEPTVADFKTGSTASAYGAPVSAPLRTKSVYRAADAPVSENISSIDVPETPVTAPEEDVPTSFVRAILDEDCRYTADVTVTGAEAVFEDGYVCVNDVVVLDDSAIRQGHVYNGDIQAPEVPEGTIVQIAMYYITEDKQLLWCASVTYTCIDGVLVSEVAE